jgi:hypothetical protein
MRHRTKFSRRGFVGPSIQLQASIVLIVLYEMWYAQGDYSLSANIE